MPFCVWSPMGRSDFCFASTHSVSYFECDASMKRADLTLPEDGLHQFDPPRTFPACRVVARVLGPVTDRGRLNGVVFQ